MIVDIAIDENFNQVISGNRAREIFDIDTMLSHGNVIVYGEAGIGKTALLKAFAKVNSRAFKSINFHHGYEIEMDDSLLVPYLLPKPSHALKEPTTLIIIDGFDEIKSTTVKEKIAQIMIDGRINRHRVILRLVVKLVKKYLSKIHVRCGYEGC